MDLYSGFYNSLAQYEVHHMTALLVNEAVGLVWSMGFTCYIQGGYASSATCPVITW